MCFSGLNGCNKHLSGLELSYHSGPDDLIAEVCQMFSYSHSLNVILKYGASDQLARMMTYSCSRLVPIRTIESRRLFHGDFIMLYWEPAMIHIMFQKYDVMKQNPYWLV